MFLLTQYLSKKVFHINIKDILKSEQISPPKMDPRDYGIGAQILVDLGLNEIKILTDNPRKVVGLDAYNLSITEQISLSS